MLKNTVLTVFLLVVAAAQTPARAAQSGVEQADTGAKELSGMSILGNSEAPKSLVIVPWKTSEIGDGIGVSNMLDNRARPVDREVFVRELDFYELRTGAAGKVIGPGLPDVSAQLAGQEPDL